MQYLFIQNDNFLPGSITGNLAQPCNKIFACNSPCIYVCGSFIKILAHVRDVMNAGDHRIIHLLKSVHLLLFIVHPGR